ncbi:hypothetical protein [Paramicrobacterium chengjingii]|uniref:PqqD family peptide modification chaperone n=1 Tax=Paramicrobacterium chengjingii TaxID=2769067 RepID=A0ABX6YF88_9MICO|nr:hypothetical protein [Microbacterium chengjingii]QPZ37468.1 hypothetical protein HCR76_11550 [Microbacterium chengjingii]
MARLFTKQRRLDVDVLGSTIRLSFLTDEPDEHYDRLRRAWSGATVSRRRPDSTLAVGTNVAKSKDYDAYGADYDALAATVSTKVTLRGIELARGKHLMLHAAGVALPDGRVVAFVAPSGGGKTTLASHLGKQFGYVSDETVLIDRDLRVFPYRKPLSVIEDPEKKWRKTQVSPDELNLLALPRTPLTLAAIVLFERDANHGDSPELGNVALPEAIEDLSGQISYFGDLPDSACMLADVVHKTGGVRTLRYSEADSVASVLDQIIAEQHPDTDWSDVSSTVTEHRADDTYTRRDGVVAVNTAGSIVTMSDGTVRVLSGLSPVIWEVIANGARLEVIERALVEEFGAPEGMDARDVTQQAVDTLMAEGLISFNSTKPVQIESPW